jgi:hypothetical protein
MDLGCPSFQVVFGERAFLQLTGAAQWNSAPVPRFSQIRTLPLTGTGLRLLEMAIFSDT